MLSKSWKTTRAGGFFFGGVLFLVLFYFLQFTVTELLLEMSAMQQETTVSPAPRAVASFMGRL